MKNLYKKISAVLLAGMVVAGGFAASGAQSFALLYGPGSEQIADEGMKKLQDIIDDSIYAGVYKVINSYKVEGVLLQDVYSKHPDGGFSPVVSRLSKRYPDRHLKSLLARKLNIVMVQSGGKYYLIEKQY